MRSGMTTKSSRIGGVVKANMMVEVSVVARVKATMAVRGGAKGGVTLGVARPRPPPFSSFIVEWGLG